MKRIDRRTGGVGLGLIGLLWQVAAVAQEAGLPAYVPPESQPFSPSPTLLLLRAGGSLVLVLGLVLATAWLVKVRSGLSPADQAGRLKLIETCPIATNRAVHLVGLGDKVLLLGSGESVTHLGTFTAAEVGWDPDRAAPDFGQLLTRLNWLSREPVKVVNS